MRFLSIRSVALSLAVLGSLWVIAKCSSNLVYSQSPEQILAETIKALDSNNLDNATQILDLKPDKIIWKHWLLLYQGVLQERKQNFYPKPV